MYSWVSQKICKILIYANLRCVCHVAKIVHVVESTSRSSIEASVLSCYALLHLVRDLKAAQMKLQPIQIRELTLYELELDDKATEA